MRGATTELKSQINLLQKFVKRKKHWSCLSVLDRNQLHTDFSLWGSIAPPLGIMIKPKNMVER